MYIQIASNCMLCILWLQVQCKSPFHSQDNLSKLWICNPKIPKIFCCHGSMKQLLPVITDSVFQKFDYIAVVFSNIIFMETPCCFSMYLIFREMWFINSFKKHSYEGLNIRNIVGSALHKINIFVNRNTVLDI